MGTLAPLTGIRQHGNKQLRVALKAKTRHIRRTCKRQDYDVLKDACTNCTIPQNCGSGGFVSHRPHISATSVPHRRHVARNRCGYKMRKVGGQFRSQWKNGRWAVPSDRTMMSDRSAAYTLLATDAGL
eukprot:2750766-Pyramimonas_sp.AAC.1